MQKIFCLAKPQPEPGTILWLPSTNFLLNPLYVPISYRYCKLNLSKKDSDECGEGNEDHAADSDLAQELPVIVGLSITGVPTEIEDVVSNEAQADQRYYFEVLFARSFVI